MDQLGVDNALWHFYAAKMPHRAVQVPRLKANRFPNRHRNRGRVRRVPEIARQQYPGDTEIALRIYILNIYGHMVSVRANSVPLSRFLSLEFHGSAKGTTRIS